MDILQNPLLAGLPSLLVSLAVMVAISFYINKSAKSKAEELTKDANDKTINAQKEYNDILNTRLKDRDKEYRHLEQTLTTILDVLKSREIYITISDHTINIREGKETTITRIHDEQKES